MFRTIKPVWSWQQAWSDMDIMDMPADFEDWDLEFEQTVAPEFDNVAKLEITWCVLKY